MITIVSGEQNTCILWSPLPSKTHTDLFLCGHMDIFKLGDERHKDCRS
mgnify:CR=1 FL=1